MGWSSKYLLLWCLGEYSNAIFYRISNLPLNNLGHKPSKLPCRQLNEHPDPMEIEKGASPALAWGGIEVGGLKMGLKTSSRL